MNRSQFGFADFSSCFRICSRAVCAGLRSHPVGTVEILNGLFHGSLDIRRVRVESVHGNDFFENQAPVVLHGQGRDVGFLIEDILRVEDAEDDAYDGRHDDARRDLQLHLRDFPLPLPLLLQPPVLVGIDLSLFRSFAHEPSPK